MSNRRKKVSRSKFATSVYLSTTNANRAVEGIYRPFVDGVDYTPKTISNLPVAQTPWTDELGQTHQKITFRRAVTFSTSAATGKGMILYGSIYPDGQANPDIQIAAEPGVSSVSVALYKLEGMRKIIPLLNGESIRITNAGPASGDDPEEENDGFIFNEIVEDQENLIMNLRGSIAYGTGIYKAYDFGQVIKSGRKLDKGQGLCLIASVDEAERVPARMTVSFITFNYE